MDMSVNISGNVNFFVPVLSGSPDGPDGCSVTMKRSWKAVRPKRRLLCWTSFRIFWKSARRNRTKGKAKRRQEGRWTRM